MTFKSATCNNQPTVRGKTNKGRHITWVTANWYLQLVSLVSRAASGLDWQIGAPLAQDPQTDGGLGSLVSMLISADISTAQYVYFVTSKQLFLHIMLICFLFILKKCFQVKFFPLKTNRTLPKKESFLKLFLFCFILQNALIISEHATCPTDSL